MMDDGLWPSVAEAVTAKCLYSLMSYEMLKLYEAKFSERSLKREKAEEKAIRLWERVTPCP